MKNWLISGAALALTVVPSIGQVSGQQAPVAPATSATVQRALLDKYCVTCHNDKTKVDNFSLQKEDINAVADHPDVWERVIRKLRAGMMPPPGMPRPPFDGSAPDGGHLVAVLALASAQRRLAEHRDLPSHRRTDIPSARSRSHPAYWGASES